MRLHPTVEERFWSKVDKSGDCWLWLGATARNGYGRFRWNGRAGEAHRYAYVITYGDIPDGCEVDHLCFNHPCVRPTHLEAVTHAENQRRWSASFTHCLRGHPLTPDNIYWTRGRRERRCRTCHLASMAATYLRKRRKG